MFMFFKDVNKTVLNLNNLVSFSVAQWLNNNEEQVVLQVNHSIIGMENLVYTDNRERNEDLKRLLESLQSMNSKTLAIMRES